MQDLRSQEEIISTWNGDIISPQVSICCISYNHESYINDALRGFLRQETDFPIEILIYDDASTDKTQKIIKQYEEEYPQIIKAIYQKDNQFSKGVNVGIEFNLKRAIGQYIALCEGDDFWSDAKKLQTQKEFLDKSLDYVICYTDAQSIDESGHVTQGFNGSRKDLSAVELQRASSISTLTAFFRNVLQDNPAEFYNARYGDLTLWSRLGDYGKGKYLSSVKPSMYRVHSGGIHSMQTREKQLQMRLETMMGLYSYRLKRCEHDLADYFLEEVVVQAFKLQKFKLLKKLLKRIFCSMLRKASSFFLSKP